MARLKRLYAPYTKVNGKWVRATYEYADADGNGKIAEYAAMTKDVAIRRYQSWLLAPFLNGVDEIRELRPVKE